MNKFRRMFRFGALLALACTLSAHAYGQASSVTDYRRAWPSQVPVLQPDPVLGKEKVWEYWIYDKTFAERFQGFDSARASSEMAPGVHAIVFRTFKERIFDLRPEMFRCEYEVYFDSRVRIPLGDLDAPTVLYPAGVSASLRRLRPVRDEDAKHLAEARPEKKTGKSQPLILADGPLDGRHARFGLTYYANVVPGISLAVLGRGGSQCEVLAPKRPGSHYWIWLFGEVSFDPQALQNRYGEAFRKWLTNGTFDPGARDGALVNGFVFVPEKFYEKVLPKVTLVKAVTQCISYRSGYEQGHLKDVRGSKAAVFAACAEVDSKGEIYEIGLSGVVKGWHKLRF